MNVRICILTSKKSSINILYQSRCFGQKSSISLFTVVSTLYFQLSDTVSNNSPTNKLNVCKHFTVLYNLIKFKQAVSKFTLWNLQLTPKMKLWK